MTAVAATLLAELRSAGVTVAPAIDLDGPADALTDARLAEARRLKAELLRLLLAETDAPAAPATPMDRRLVADPDLATIVEAAQRMFAPEGGVEIVAVRPSKSAARDAAARLIRDARRGGDDGQAVALRERVAVCTIDGELPVEDAERVALDAVAESA